MDGKTERIEGASIEPMAISSVEAVNGAPASVYRVNPDAEPDRWFPLLPEKYKAYKGKGKTIKVTQYFRVLDRDGVEHTMPLGTHFFMDRQPVTDGDMNTWSRKATAFLNWQSYGTTTHPFGWKSMTATAIPLPTLM